MVHGIHYLMGALLFVKCVCLLVESIRFHFIAIDGSSEAWSVVYYLVTTLRGTHMDVDDMIQYNLQPISSLRVLDVLLSPLLLYSLTSHLSLPSPLSGVMLFTVILLIGSGWSLMKAHLNDKERKIILIVLSMQVLSPLHCVE